MLRINILTASVLVLGCFLGKISFADQVQMNETLTRIERLLDQINPLINLAEMQQENDTRVKFQFETLRQDITHVQFGIDQALHRVTIQPRVVESLSGDYLPVLPSSVKLSESQNNNILLKEDESS